jgi:energy-coupling factor transporter ATP-binding protein EcfA2
MSSGTNGKNGPVVGYLTRVGIKDIRSITSLRWEAAPSPGWNVLLGDNGAGKTTFLRVIAYAVLNEDRAVLRLNPSSLLRAGATFGNIHVFARVEGHDPEQGAVITIRDGGADSVAPTQPQLAELFVAGFGPFRRFTGRDAEHDQQFDTVPRIARVASLFDERW